METPPSTSTPTDTPTPSSDPPPPSSSDPPPSTPIEPPASSAPSPNPNPNSNPNPAQSQPQTLEPQKPPQLQQRTPPAISRPRPPTQPISRSGVGVGGGGGIAIGVPAGYSHHQRPPSSASFSSFRPSTPFGGPSSSHMQPFAAMPRSSVGGPDQARQPVPGVQTIGMIGSLSTSQMRPTGALGQNQQRLGQPQLRSVTPPSQGLNSQKFPSHLGPRGPSITSPITQSPASQSSQPLHQQWMSSQAKQTNAASLPSSSYRPQMRPPTMQQRPQLPQHHQQTSISQQQQQQKQHQLQQIQHMQQQSSLQNQSQDNHPLRNQPNIPPQHQASQVLVPTTQKSSVQALAQPGLGSNDTEEISNDIISRKRIRELVTQVDRSEKLRPEIEDDLLEIADDFIESIVTAACHLAKHRKSTTLEAKDILVHVERHWNMALPGFSGDEIKCYKKPSTNDIHKERLAMIKKSMVGTHDGGTSTKTPASGSGQAAANPKLH